MTLFKWLFERRPKNEKGTQRAAKQMVGPAGRTTLGTAKPRNC
jgi:hypothetical protein